MKKFAVVKTGGKQYLVSQDDSIIVDRITVKEGADLPLDTVARFDEDGEKIELGTPFLKESVKGQVLAHEKGEKIRVAKFRAKVRYRKVRGFRPMLTKIKIIKI